MRYFVILLVFSACVQLAKPQANAPEWLHTVTNGVQGREFWITVPPNDLSTATKSFLNVIISSPVAANVELFDAARGTTKTYAVEPGKLRTLSTVTGEADWSWEIREHEIEVTKGIRLRSDQPINVSVINSKIESTDGYTALPVSMWDTSYIVTSYYDYLEEYGSVKIPWAGGFTIIAAEDDTYIQIYLRGVGAQKAKTSGGMSINTGKPLIVVLNAGQVYYVEGDATTRGVFDLTGTAINSDKPIGVISSHMRTTVPSLLSTSRGRNHLVEMNLPVSSWGTSYTSLEIKRESTGFGKGDVFRVIASDSNTTWTLKYYNAFTKTLLGQAGGTLSKPGDFADISNVASSTVLTNGVSVWTADKPIQVVQYSCSWAFDGDKKLDPFQINLMPDERRATGAFFHIAADAKFTDHFVTLVTTADPTDPLTVGKLKSITIDKKPVWTFGDSYPAGLLNNNITSTNIWYVNIPIENSTISHVLSSPELPISGYIYGYGNVDCYGWPLGTLNSNVVSQDTSAPTFALTSITHSSWKLIVEEKVNIPSPVREHPLPTDQVDAGIALVELDSGAINLKIIEVRAPGAKRTEATEAEYRVEVLDAKKVAGGRVLLLDYAANVSYAEVHYDPPALTLNTQTLNFGSVKVGTTKTMSASVTNTSNASVDITGVANSSPIFSSSVSLPMQVGATVTAEIPVSVSPVSVGDFFDTLRIAFSEHELLVPMSVKGVQTKLTVSNSVDLGHVEANDTICADGKLTIVNQSTDTVEISSLAIVEQGSEFFVTTENCQPLPIEVLPGATVEYDCFCYTSEMDGSDSATLVIVASDEASPHIVRLYATTDKASLVSEVSDLPFEVYTEAQSIEVVWNADFIPIRWVLATIRGGVALSDAVQLGANSLSVRTSGFQPGVYLLQVFTASNVFSKVVLVGL